MAHHFEHTSRYTQPAETVRAALAGEQYWKDRLAAIGGSRAELSNVNESGGTVTVDVQQAVAADKLPSLVSKIRPGALVIRRTESIGPLDAGKASGQFSAIIDGAPATITGVKTIEPDGTGCVVRLDGNIEVKIPLVGGKIESAIEGQLGRLFEMEDEFTEQWLTSQP